MVTFEIHTNMSWAGFGLVPTSTSTRMTQLKGQYCVTSSQVVSLSGFSSTGNRSPTQQLQQAQVTTSEESFYNGWSKCIFQRPLSSTQLYDLDRRDLYSVLAVGDSINIDSYGGDPTMQYHGASNKLWYSDINYMLYPVGKMGVEKSFNHGKPAGQKYSNS